MSKKNGTPGLAGIVISFLLFQFVCPRTFADTPETQTRDAAKTRVMAQIKEASKPWDTVERWLFEYDALPPTNDEVFSPVHRIIAAAAPGAFYHLGAHFSVAKHGFPWQVDPLAQELFIYNGVCCHRWRFNRTYSEKRMKIGEEIDGSIPQDVLLNVIPKWPLSHYSLTAPVEGTKVIPAEAISSSRYSLVAENEIINNESCVVFDNGKSDRLWIAAHKGVCVMRREIREPKSGLLKSRLVTDKVEQIAPGLWLPIEFKNQIFAQDKVTLEIKVRIVGWALKDKVSESLFIPVHLAGSLKCDNERRFTQVSAGGQNLLSEVVDFIFKYASQPVPRFQKIRTSDCLIAGFLIAILSSILFLRLNKTQPSCHNTKSKKVDSCSVSSF